MKRTLVIIVLAALQYGCAGQPATTDYGNSLISFTEIADEISVSYQSIDASDGKDDGKNGVKDDAIILGYAE